MTNLAGHHRRIADVLEPFEQMGVDAAMAERATDDGDLCLTLDLRVPAGLDPVDGDAAAERFEDRMARSEQFREDREGIRDDAGGLEAELEGIRSQLRVLGEHRDETRERVDRVLRRTETLQRRVAELEERVGESGGEDPSGVEDGGEPGTAPDGLTDGERETLHAMRELGGASASGEIAEEVDATLQSVRSWLPKLVKAGHVRAETDPTDGRRKLYAPAEDDDPTDDGGFGGSMGTETIGDDGSDADGTGSNTIDDGPGGDDAGPDTTDDDGSDADDAGPDTIDDDGSGGDDAGSENVDEDSDDVEGDGDDEAAAPTDGPVYIASRGGSPSQVFHVREDCPQLRKSADFVEKDRSVVPHHRPCGNCVPDGLGGGLVAVAKGSATTTYHEREDCPKLGSATEVAVLERETVPDYDPCDDCVHRDEESDAEADAADAGPTVADICARNDLRREAVVDALDAATAIYHVQRDLALSKDDTEALLRGLGVFEDLDGGGHLTTGRAKAVVREHLPPPNQPEPDGGENRD